MKHQDLPFGIVEIPRRRRRGCGLEMIGLVVGGSAALWVLLALFVRWWFF